MDLTKQRILEVAGPIFAEKGFRGATVREICDRAGANLAAVNYHFGDKEQLYRASLRNAFQCGLERLPLPQWPAGTPPGAKLRDFIATVITHMIDEIQMPWQMQLLLHELSQPSEAGAELVRDFIRPIYEVLWGILREALPADLPEERLHLIGFSIIGQCFYHRIGRHVIPVVVGEEEARSYTPNRLAEHIARFSLAALGYEQPFRGGGAP
jgi:AcrR family transcriptional regulator